MLNRENRNTNNKFEIFLQIRAKNGILQRLLDEMNWSQAQLAKYLGVSNNYVNVWINLRGFPKNQIVIDKLCKIIGKPFEDIFPDFLKNPEFLKLNKSYTTYKEVEVQYLPNHKLPEIEYIEQDQSEIHNNKEIISKAIDTLPLINKEIVKKFFGIDDIQLSIPKIGIELNLSNDVIKRKLKHSIQTLKSKLKNHEIFHDALLNNEPDIDLVQLENEIQ